MAEVVVQILEGSRSNMCGCEERVVTRWVQRKHAAAYAVLPGSCPSKQRRVVCLWRNSGTPKGTDVFCGGISQKLPTTPHIHTLRRACSCALLWPCSALVNLSEKVPGKQMEPGGASQSAQVELSLLQPTNVPPSPCNSQKGCTEGLHSLLLPDTASLRLRRSRPHQIQKRTSGGRTPRRHRLKRV